MCRMPEIGNQIRVGVFWGTKEIMQGIRPGGKVPLVCWRRADIFVRKNLKIFNILSLTQRGSLKGVRELSATGRSIQKVLAVFLHSPVCLGRAAGAPALTS